MATNFFPSRKRHCAACLQRTLTVNGEAVIEYYHRGVVCHLVGYDMALPLDVEMLRPGEGEVSAACRLLERVFANYARFFDAVLGDALYCEAGFFNFCLQHGKDVMAVLKGDDRQLKRDATLRFSQMVPETWTADNRQIQAWNLDGFRTMTGVNHPIRVMHSREEWTKRSRVASAWVLEEQTSDWWWATTITTKRLPTSQLRRAGHSRWDIENDNFNALGRSWGLDHCFKHTPQAILNFVLTVFVVHVLLQSFGQRNLKTAQRIGLPLIALARELFADWVAAGRVQPWLEPRSPPDTS